MTLANWSEGLRSTIWPVFAGTQLCARSKLSVTKLPGNAWKRQQRHEP